MSKENQKEEFDPKGTFNRLYEKEIHRWNIMLRDITFAAITISLIKQVAPEEFAELKDQIVSLFTTILQYVKEYESEVKKIVDYAKSEDADWKMLF